MHGCQGLLLAHDAGDPELCGSVQKVQQKRGHGTELRRAAGDNFAAIFARTASNS
jgi:hypothetical protein